MKTTNENEMKKTKKRNENVKKKIIIIKMSCSIGSLCYSDCGDTCMMKRFPCETLSHDACQNTQYCFLKNNHCYNRPISSEMKECPNPTTGCSTVPDLTTNVLYDDSFINSLFQAQQDGSVSLTDASKNLISNMIVEKNLNGLSQSDIQDMISNAVSSKIKIEILYHIILLVIIIGIAFFLYRKLKPV